MPPRILSETEYNTLRDRVLKAAPDGLDEAGFNRYVGPAMEQALGEAENTNAPVEGSALERFAAGAWKTLNPMGVVNAIRHPITTASGIIGASVDQARQAKNAAAMGRYVEAAGHGLAAAIPVIGPAAAQAGESIAQGDVAGGLGQAAGLEAPFAAGEALRLRNAPNPRAAEMATRAATDQVAGRVLAPGNPAYRGRAVAIAPEILQRGLSGGREDLRQAAAEGMADAGARLDEAIANAGGTKAPISVLPVIGKMQQSIEDLSDSNGIPLSGQAAQRITALKERITHLQSLGKTGTVSFEDLRKLRDENYRLADEARGYERQGNPALADEGWAARETGSAIRQTLASRSPESAAANADFTFWKTLDKVLDPVIGRPKNMAPTMGVTGGTRTIGAVTGALVAGKAGAFIGSTVIPWLKEHVATPQWQLADAQSKMRLAEGLRKGDVGLMKSAMVKIAQYGKTTSPSESQPAEAPAASTP